MVKRRQLKDCGYYHCLFVRYARDNVRSERIGCARDSDGLTQTEYFTVPIYI